MIIVGTPVYWGNMNGKLKSLFDRLVGIMMAESKSGNLKFKLPENQKIEKF